MIAPASGVLGGVALDSVAPQPGAVSMPRAGLLSVIIVAYKSRDEIEACLESIPRTVGAWEVEVIVVDNFPADGVADLISARFPYVRYVPVPENVGFGRGNNRGFALSRGDMVLFLNPDTVVNEAALAHGVGRLHSDERIGLFSPKLVMANGSMDLACRRSIPTIWDGFCRAAGLAARFPHRALFAGYNLTHLPADGTYNVGAINGAFMLTPRCVLVAIAENGAVFDEQFFMYGDDLDLCIRVARAGFRIVYDGRVSITHLKGQSVAKDYDAMSHAIFDANRDVYLKHFGQTGFARLTIRGAFAAWKAMALWRARRQGYRRVKPV